MPAKKYTLEQDVARADLASTAEWRDSETARARAAIARADDVLASQARDALDAGVTRADVGRIVGISNWYALQAFLARGSRSA